MTSTTDVTPARGFRASEWDAAVTWDAWLESLEQKQDLWRSHDRRAAIHPDEAARLTALPGRRRVLVLTEDWCGDAIRSLPALAAAADASDQVEMRFLPSDDHPEVLSRHLTHGGRAIPMAIVVDEDGKELGTWGPRPAPLQALLRARMRELGRPTAETMAEFYAPIMGWYAKDAGRTSVQELLVLLERGGEER